MATPIKFTNNAFATLASSITNSATSITLTSGQGARFPSLSAGEHFHATLIDTNNNLEIVKCTARSTDVLTVVRAQESTTGRAYASGDRIEIRLTAQAISDVSNINYNVPAQTGNADKVLITNGSVVSWGLASSGATGGGTDTIFVENGQTVTTNYTITTNKNAMSTGPITVNSGITVTIPTGSRYVII